MSLKLVFYKYLVESPVFVHQLLNEIYWYYISTNGIVKTEWD